MQVAQANSAFVRAVYSCNAGFVSSRLHPQAFDKYRTEFQRDCDRIVHSTSFRRLMHKTQVFIEPDGDHYRTRLTHTIEVTRAARSLARTLGLNADLTEAVALAHDLGHTPFGHAGEQVLEELMAKFGGFEHNAQAIRIVTKLEKSYEEFDGLNLTWETLEGIAKHNGPVLGDIPAALREYNARHDLRLHTYPSAEAQVAALSDDIAYNCHDLQDGLRAGWFDLKDISHLPIVGEEFERRGRTLSSAGDSRLHNAVLRGVFDSMAENLIETSTAVLKDTKPESVGDIRELGFPVIGFSDVFCQKMNAIRDFLKENLYRSEKMEAERSKSQRVIAELFEHFMASPSDLPENWRPSSSGPADNEAKARAVADYIACMTDTFASKTHEQLTTGNGKSSEFVGTV